MAADQTARGRKSIVPNDDPLNWIECFNCGVHSAVFARLENARVAWNTRTNSINTTLPAEDGQSTHTPGPWKAEMAGMNVLACDDQMMICNIRGWGYLTGRGGLNLPDDQAIAIQDANTRLIAAAPALYSAVVATLKYVDNLNEEAPTYAACPKCTSGSVPDKWNQGLCFIHLTQKAVKEAKIT